MRFAAYDASSDSGVEWLGFLPGVWETVRLKRLLQANDSGTWGDEPTGDGDTVVLRSTDMDLGGEWRTDDPATRQLTASERASCRLVAGDIVVTKSSGSALHLGKAAVVTPEIEALCCCFSNFMQRLRPRPDLASRYLFYYLNCPVGREQVNFLGTTTTGLANLNAAILGNLLIPHPPLPEQRAIAAFLDRETGRIDEMIAAKQRLIGLLEEKRTALISHAVTRGLNPHAPLRDTGIEWLGQIPEHWSALPLRRLLRPTAGAIRTGPFGSQLLSSDMMGSDIKVYNQRSVIDRDLDAGEGYISTEKFRQLQSFEVFPGDVLVTTRGTIGRCTVVGDGAERGILHPCLMRIQPEPSRLLPEYLCLLVEDSSIVRMQLQLMSNATTIDVIYSDNMRRVVLPLPPVDEQREIVSWLAGPPASLVSLTVKVREAIERLQEYRTALISAAVTGKIDVRGSV